jgi:hypothetical protein
MISVDARTEMLGDRRPKGPMDGLPAVGDRLQARYPIRVQCPIERIWIRVFCSGEVRAHTGKLGE